MDKVLPTDLVCIHLNMKNKEIYLRDEHGEIVKYILDEVKSLRINFFEYQRMLDNRMADLRKAKEYLQKEDYEAMTPSERGAAKLRCK